MSRDQQIEQAKLLLLIDLEIKRAQVMTGISFGFLSIFTIVICIAVGV